MNTSNYVEEKERSPLIELGLIVITCGAADAMAKAKMSPCEVLDRHVCGDWGDLCEEDKQANEMALIKGYPLLSAYTLGIGEILYVISDADRRTTTVLRPD